MISLPRSEACNSESLNFRARPLIAYLRELLCRAKVDRRFRWGPGPGLVTMATLVRQPGTQGWVRLTLETRPPQ